jgi:hypothetical protein
MGRIRRAFHKIFNRTEELIEPEPQKDNSKFEMTSGKRLTFQEIIEENKIIISTLDPKMNFLLELIKEIKGEDLLPEIAKDPVQMQQWLAHIAYRKRIDDFNFLISGKSRNTLDPSVLVKAKHRKQSIRKRIKCLTDLPLQKSLLN